MKVRCCTLAPIISFGVKNIPYYRRDKKNSRWCLEITIYYALLIGDDIYG
jgi:hypothetical protein